MELGVRPTTAPTVWSQISSCCAGIVSILGCPLETDQHCAASSFSVMAAQHLTKKELGSFLDLGQANKVWAYSASCVIPCNSAYIRVPAWPAQCRKHVGKEVAPSLISPGDRHASYLSSMLRSAYLSTIHSFCCLTWHRPREATRYSVPIVILATSRLHSYAVGS